MRYVKDRLEDIVAGLVTGGIGLFIILEASSYRLGTLVRMGPGYFPRMLGIAMVVLAIMMILTARPSTFPMSITREQWRGVGFLTAAFGSFVLTIESYGLLMSVTLAVFLAALANRQTTILTAVILAVCTAVVSTLIFRVGLGLQIRAF